MAMSEKFIGSYHAPPPCVAVLLSCWTEETVTPVTEGLSEGQTNSYMHLS